MRRIYEYSDFNVQHGKVFSITTSWQNPSDRDLDNLYFMANSGSVSAQLALAVCYAHGSLVKEDFSQTVIWLKKAAKQGSAFAQIQLGEYYVKGFGVKKNNTQARKYLRYAADFGNAYAQHKMFFMCKEGEGGKSNMEHAIYWLHRSVSQGYVPAFNSLGYCYMFGYGVEVDPGKAVKLFEKGAESGHSEAQNNLSLCYEQGVGVVSDEAKAAYWRQRYEDNSGPTQTSDHEPPDLKAMLDLSPLSIRKCANPWEVLGRLWSQHIAMSYLVGLPTYAKNANLAFSYFAEAERRIPRSLREFSSIRKVN
nr:tetratricopeptide repeat protein [uncultured Duganella sp.]